MCSNVEDVALLPVLKDFIGSVRYKYSKFIVGSNVQHMTKPVLSYIY